MEAPISTPTEDEISEMLTIESGTKKYSLSIKASEERINLNLTIPAEEGNTTLTRILNLKELKQINQFFSPINSCKDFCCYLKSLNSGKKLSIIQKENQFYISFLFEYLTKKSAVEINLSYDNKRDEYFGEVINNLKNRIEILERENKCLKEEINEIKKIIGAINIKFHETINCSKHIFNNNSVIMKENDFDMISFAIKSRLNKNIKDIKKLYQATIDGDGAINFHSRCDNIPNTLTVIQSAGNRRFGGFTTQVWESVESYIYKDDKSAFLFSLDKKKYILIKMMVMQFIVTRLLDQLLESLIAVYL